MKRISGMMILEVRGANPNGSPDWGNTPRQFNGDMGFITPMCIKRRIRDVLTDHESPCFAELAEKLKLKPNEFHIFESKERGFPGKTPQEANQAAISLADKDPDAFLTKYWDYRLLGGTLLEPKAQVDKKAKKPKETEQAEEEEKVDAKEQVRFVKTGCLTISPAYSIAPIQVVETTIGKKAPLRDKEQDLAPGGYKFVVHGLYVANFSVNPHVAGATHATDKDLEVLRTALPYAFPLATANARPASSIWPIHIWWREHTKALGSFDEYKFFESLMPKKKGEQIASNSLEDYEIPDGTEFKAIDLVKEAWTD